MMARDSSRSNILIEMKYGEDLEHLRDEVLAQILEQQYHAALEGTTLCIGLAHNKKRCLLTSKLVKG